MAEGSESLRLLCHKNMGFIVKVFVRKEYFVLKINAEIALCYAK